ncbi:hypothetical protein OOJ91_13700 [Micromonospora lupini]|uniref:hypothetical protein n=1 Tax=Micromonospora lupini TaxID=285679 RepID=UPI0022524C3E|nr:hypothetical protein [Micromonospora lupini]MCX5066901.1 hypothetical protein [Micromonospora lupini]
MTDFKTLLAGARLPEATVPVCLRGDLTAEFEDLERQLDQAQRETTASLEDVTAAAGIAERMEQVRQDMLQHTYQFRLRAMPRPAWRAFIAQHPPRKDDESGAIVEQDRGVGVNTETFFDELVRRSVVDPELTEDEWKLLLDQALTDRQFDTLANAAWGLNRRDIDVPFSLAASRMTRSSATE